MAQEKQQPPHNKAANKGERGQQKGRSQPPSLDGVGAKNFSQSPKTNNTEKPLAGQPGGPNVRSVDAARNAEKKNYSSGDGQASYGNGDSQDTAFDRRRAAPARRRFAANDDVPSIGGLIFALQQKPSNRPFVIAAIASAVWVALSASMVWSVFSAAFQDISSLAELMQSTAAMAAIAVVIIPIALFWFLALLIWRAHELRLMSSAMTEVAVRLAEPDKAAEQSVASLGQSVRRQVTAMNDAISRALGRASELEAMVHNEVAALERSYSENELRVRGLIGELAHERASLTNDSERISKALTGLGSKVTHQIESQGTKTVELLSKTSGDVSSKLIESSNKITQSMSEQSNSVVSTMTAMNDRVGREMPMLLDRMGKEQAKLSNVVEHASKNLSALDSSIGHHAGALNNALTDRTQQIEGIFRKHVSTMGHAMEERTQSLDNALSNKIQTFDNTLIQRMDDFEETLSDTTQKIDTALASKAQYLDMAISSRVAELDSALIERTKVIDAAFTERLQALDNALHKSSKTLDQAFASRAEELGRSMDSRSQYIVQTIGAKTRELDNALMSGAKTLQLTTEDVGKQVMSTIHGLAGQAQLLKDVSATMQNHVGQITHNLREQSQMVVTAATQLESSHDRIGNKLGSSHSHLQQLVESISSRTTDLDHVMASYSSQLENTLLQAEHKAREITESLHTRSASQSMEALSELTKLRDSAANQTERAIDDMKNRIASVSTEMSSQINSLSSEISDTQNNLKQQLQQIPDTTRRSASLMRRTLQDQLKALESLSSLTSGSGHAEISSPGIGGGGFPPMAGKGVAGNGLSGHGMGGEAGGKYPVQGGPGYETAGHGTPAGGPMGGQGFGGGHTLAGQPGAGAPEGMAGFGFGQGVSGGLSNKEPLRDPGFDRDKEIEAITENLAKRVTDKIDVNKLAQTGMPVDKTMPVDKGPQGSSHWSMGDLLARASEDEATGQEEANGAAMGQGADMGAQGAGMPSININAIAKLVEPTSALELWRTYRSGLRTPIRDTVYNDQGETFRRITELYQADGGFRGNVDRYISDFERLLGDAEKKDPQGNLTTKHVTSESGRVYLLLMHAAGRIGQ